MNNESAILINSIIMTTQNATLFNKMKVKSNKICIPSSTSTSIPYPPHAYLSNPFFFHPLANLAVLLAK
jgi:hypothetical protein